MEKKTPNLGLFLFALNMAGFILTNKVKQVAGFDENKKRRVYTIFKLSPCYVTQIKTLKTDGYKAIQIGFCHTKSGKNIKKTALGQGQKAGLKTPLSFFAEDSLDNFLAEEVTQDGKVGYKIKDKSFFVGSELKASELFALGDKVMAKAFSKGKGFAGVVKRHGFAGGPKTHGQSDRLRAPGSIGSGTTPGRVWKGKKMAGRMGHEVKTIKGLKVAKVSETSLYLQGLTPGAASTITTIISEKNYGQK